MNRTALNFMRRTSGVAATCLTLWSAQAAAHGTFPDTENKTVEETILEEFAAARTEAENAGLHDSAAAADSVVAQAMLWQEQGGKLAPTVCFWNGSEDLQRKLLLSDGIWQSVSRLRFDYIAENGKPRICTKADSADVRVSLDKNDKRMDYGVDREANVNWSLIGRQSTWTKGGVFGTRYLVTVNLPGVQEADERGDASNFHFLTRHEMGHARGLLHEHQREICKDWFNPEAIAVAQHWPLEKAKSAVTAFSDNPGQMEAWRPKDYGSYDMMSVMQYNFAPDWYLSRPGMTNPCKRSDTVIEPSAGDLATLVATYGAAPALIAAVPDASATAPASALAAPATSLTPVERTPKPLALEPQTAMLHFNDILERDKFAQRILVSPLALQNLQLELGPTGSVSPPTPPTSAAQAALAQGKLDALVRLELVIRKLNRLQSGD